MSPLLLSGESEVLFHQLWVGQLPPKARNIACVTAQWATMAGLLNWCFYLELLHINLSRESDYDHNHHFFRSIYVPGSVVATLCKIALDVSHQFCKVGIIILVSQKRKLRLRKIKQLAQDHRDSLYVSEARSASKSIYCQYQAYTLQMTPLFKQISTSTWWFNEKFRNISGK